MCASLYTLKLIVLFMVMIFPMPNQTKPILSDVSVLWAKISKKVESAYESIIPKSIRNLFNKNREETRHDKNSTLKEHGNLEFFGRDIVREIETTIGKIFASSMKIDIFTNKLFEKLISEFKAKIKAIYPGTYWCGDGNIAGNNASLGLFYLTDNCCREHDNCDDFISAGEKRGNLENTGLFSRSNCKCDIKFYNCLKKVNTALSIKLGLTYFTILGPQCYKNEYPIVKCNTKETGRCVKYELDVTRDKYEQWFDNPIF